MEFLLIFGGLFALCIIFIMTIVTIKKRQAKRFLEEHPSAVMVYNEELPNESISFIVPKIFKNKYCHANEGILLLPGATYNLGLWHEHRYNNTTTTTRNMVSFVPAIGKTYVAKFDKITKVFSIEECEPEYKERYL